MIRIFEQRFSCTPNGWIHEQIVFIDQTRIGERCKSCPVAAGGKDVPDAIRMPRLLRDHLRRQHRLELLGGKWVGEEESLQMFAV